MANDKGLADLFHDTVRDMYYAEQHVLKTLPKLAQAATSDELKAAFQAHEKETEDQIKRLEQVFALIDHKPAAKRCDAIEGILKEGDEHLAEYGKTSAADASLIASAQAVEHYEITRYGTLRRWAKMLTIGNAYDLLTESLEEERAADEKLTKIADAGANAEAKQGDN